ncbi:zinc finger CCCH domain-containing protein 18-like [Andrographis paniculata]|uniref:zinc finger CCCH domain-containing protein 18-like n=1 Tax=Andrographis paniculata TaxID=175694 RepID=UPI0021E7C186|nr:zinc finger CCCH domain-containing protein 18-like [Andrographis paniculata]XP_051125106.1 zinc finger CCCH domain-containing protein 18-like [Andrographis paniculata]
MDASEAAKVVLDKLSRLEPEHVAKKIVGFMCFLGYTDQDMIRIALGPDSLIHDLIQKAKTATFLTPAPSISPPISPTMNPNPSLPDPTFQFCSHFSSAASPRPVPMFRRLDSCWDHPIRNPGGVKLLPYADYMGLEDQMEVVKPMPSGFLNDFYSPEAAFGGMGVRGNRISTGPVDYPVKTCHYYSKGYCKHGNSCRYLHGESFPESYPAPMFCPNLYEGGDDQAFSPGSLEKLEVEIVELLKSRRGNPLSIASLPMLYYEKYGKTLQAEGYLTESQRHGKAGYSLTKLLARLRNSIRLIDRPHGQHAVVLTEDAPKYMDVRGERNEPGHIVNGSRQIYLTFPAESTFTEEDVSDYFSSYGPVQDVRIPCQQKRMFGFVTFERADTVKEILSKGNPHYVCGARVLVKPYREKSKLIERKYMERFDHPAYYNPHRIDFEQELQAVGWEPSRLFRRQQQRDELEHALELETMRLSQLNMRSKPFAAQATLPDVYSSQTRAVQSNFPSAERYNYLLDVLNSSSTRDDHPEYPANTCGDQENAQGLNLPDSPFAPAVASSISAVI